MRARPIVDAAAARGRGGSLFGKTVETVLAERPCRVIIELRRRPASGDARIGARRRGRRRGRGAGA